MKYGDSVIYVRDGQPLNALVAQSFQTVDGETLNLIYLAPGVNVIGQRMVNLLQSAFSVKPLADGAKFGWKDTAWTNGNGFSQEVAEKMVEHDESKIASLKSELSQTTEGRDKALQVVADENAIKPFAPEQLDEVQGPVPAGDPASPHAIETKTYADGTVATGTGPLPEQPPAEQDASQLATQINANLDALKK